MQTVIMFLAILVAALAFIIIAVAVMFRHTNDEQWAPEVKGGFNKRSETFKGPDGIVTASNLAESHRSGRERDHTGEVILVDGDINEYTVHHAQWLVDNESNFPDWGIKVINRLSDSPRQVYRQAVREAYKGREIPNRRGNK